MNARLGGVTPAGHPIVGRTDGGLAVPSQGGALPLPGMGLPQTTAAEPTCLRRLELFVPGEPKPMGSKTAFVVQGKFGPRAVVTDGKAGKVMRSWKDSIIGAVIAAWGEQGRMLGPVAVMLEFRLARPAGHHGKRGLLPSAPRWPAVKPDADKLARLALDALTVAVLADDSRVVDLAVHKRYAQDGQPTGAQIVVEELA